jgi:hypothetical protein
MREPLTGAACDATHPLPGPKAGVDWIDSMEYGALQRRPSPYGMQDTDTAATWRLVAATMWEAPCLPQHLSEVADDPYLTTHLMAAAVLVGLPRKQAIYAMALEQVGAAEALNALHDGGLPAGLEAVQRMSDDSRRKTVQECVAVLLHGWIALRLDIGDHVVKGQRITRGRD